MWTTRAFFILGHIREMEWKRRRRRSQFSMKSEIPGEECVSLLYSAAWMEWTGGALLFNPSTMAHQHRETNTPPTSTTTTTLRRLMDEGLSTSHRNIYGFKFLFWPDRFIVYSPKKFQRPFFYLKIYFPRGEIHFFYRLIHHSTKRKYHHTADERFCIYLFPKPILVMIRVSAAVCYIV